MRCFVAVVRCFMRRCREVEEAVELFTKSDFARRRRGVTRFLWAVNFCCCCCCLFYFAGSNGQVSQ